MNIKSVSEIQDSFAEFLIFCFGAVIGIGIGFICALDINTEKGYKAGQIDYANNIVKYELVKQKNNQTIWSEKNKVKGRYDDN